MENWEIQNNSVVHQQNVRIVDESGGEEEIKQSHPPSVRVSKVRKNIMQHVNQN